MSRTVKIKVLSTVHGCRGVFASCRPFRDMTVGKVYEAELYAAGQYDAEGTYCQEDTVAFLDDVGAYCAAHVPRHEGASFEYVD